ncbi:hypothetical protein, variant [Capsaspora owczarzaki ATCC 30864]|uniref:Plus3 domain-containing protein n=2 Tax=Capsaspora owczarzaki (strain ATCC 30864) TaxID=595528 RepID=A0A0D2UAD5_CAPO3|nr:hypothetical protein CAOG_003045 [Capsaspora owczarzaki ATCC 30864]KJE92007.1 hypothetical protein, variant [Capsaspora owczarzaki ATCC 30864]
MGDAADRERLFALSEVDREAVLFERSEKIQALKERQIIRQQLREKAAREGKGRSNRASSSRSKDGKTSKKGQKSSSSSSSKKKDKSSSRKSRGGDSDDQLEVEALGERGRNSKSAAQLERERALKDLSLRRAAGSTSQDAFTFAGDRHSDQETDRQRDDGATAMSIDDDQPPEAPLTLDDLNRARLTRSKLEKYVHAPFFAKSIRNCYVRVNIGVSNGQTTYRLAKVAGVEEGKKAYQLGATRTNKLIELDYCGSHRSYRLEYVSNTDFTESEFYKWKDDMAFNRIPLPSLDELRHRSKQIQSMSQHVRTSQVIDAMLQERNRFQKAPEGLAYAKTSLAHEISVLEQQGDPQGLLPGLREKLAETEAAAEENNKKATENLSLVSQINAKNRHKNLSDLGRKASGEKVVSKLDPFERRACRPVMFAFPKEDPNASHATAAPAAPVEVNTAKTTHADAPKPAFEARSYQVDPVAAQKALFGASIGVSSAKAPEKSALPPIRDLFASADLRLDIDVSTSAPVTMPGITPTSAVRRAMPDNKNRTISFADYKQRNGLF